MKKYIDRWSYWLGLASFVIAMVMRTFNAFGVFLPGTVVQGMTIWYMSFYKAALLFLLVNIATSIRMYLRILIIQRANATNESQVTGGGPAAGKFRTAAVGA